MGEGGQDFLLYLVPCPRLGTPGFVFSTKSASSFIPAILSAASYAKGFRFDAQALDMHESPPPSSNSHIIVQEARELFLFEGFSVLRNFQREFVVLM